MLKKTYITPDDDTDELNTIISPSRVSFSTRADWILLNVGGRYFQTTRSTLSKEESFLGQLFQYPSDSKSDIDERGAYLVDRDPEYFSVILNYLRHGKLIVTANITEEGVLEEAQFYNIQSLIDLIRERIREREKRKFDEETRNRVYRVLQCKEKEITQFMSSLTDGWKFEQLICHSPSSSGYMYPEGEFLCIVSKQYARDSPEALNSPVTERVKILRERGSRM